jgi:tRNA(fMet)-specific endonuclease VapC
LVLLIDSSVIIAAERAAGSLTPVLERLTGREIAISAITASELLHGVHRAEGAWRRGIRERFVEEILEDLPVIPFDLEVARVHSRIWADLKRQGQMIGTHDLAIAATALAHGMCLVTGNPREFGRIEGLEMNVW